MFPPHLALKPSFLFLFFLGRFVLLHFQCSLFGFCFEKKKRLLFPLWKGHFVDFSVFPFVSPKFCSFYLSLPLFIFLYLSLSLALSLYLLIYFYFPFWCIYFVFLALFPVISSMVLFFLFPVLFCFASPCFIFVVVYLKLRFLFSTSNFYYSTKKLDVFGEVGGCNKTIIFNNFNFKMWKVIVIGPHF